MKAPQSAFIPFVGWLRHDPGDEVISLLRQGYFEAAEQAFLWLYLRPGDTVIDGGAHIGLYSVLAHRAMEGKGRVIAVEPNEHTAEHLQANLEENGVEQARIVRAALWKTVGSVGFVDDEKEGRTAYARVALDGEARVKVRAVTLDKLVEESGSGEVAFVKIDVEGAEPEALAGLKDAAAKRVAPLLMVEMAEHNLLRRGFTTRKLAAQIESMGYALYEFSPETLRLKRVRVEGPIWFQNLFACIDPKRVNERLRSAPTDRITIARDILGRAAACSRFKELEELERLRHVGELAEANRQWAERTEGLLATERESTSMLRQSLEDAGSRLAAAEELAGQNKFWAEHGDEIVASLEARLAASEKLAEDNRLWAVRTEEVLASERAVSQDLASRLSAVEPRIAESTKLAEENREWAERTEEMLASERAAVEPRIAESTKLAEENRAWAERTEEMLASQKAISEDLTRRLSALEANLLESAKHAEDNRIWAERAEELLLVQRASAEDLASRLSAKQRAAEDNRAWAERTEALLASQKVISDDLGRRLSALETRLAESAKLAEDNRLWAERTEAKLAATARDAELNRARAEKTQQQLEEQLARVEEARARLKEAADLLDRLKTEIEPLRVFARRAAWLYRLSRRFDAQS